MNTDPIVIVGAARTPMGGFLGDFKDVAAPALGARAIRRGGRAGGRRPPRRRRNPDGLRAAGGSGPGAGAPGRARRRPAAAAGCTTINKMCGSGMKAAMLAHDLLRAGSARGRGRRRHGEHEQRALSARPRARRLSHGPRPDHSTTCSSTGSKTLTTRAA